MEIITGVERRRRWRAEEKLRILAEIDSGAKLNDVARRHDVSRGLIWRWREAQRRERLVKEAAVFVPVRVMLPDLPLALAQHLQACAVDHQVQRAAPRALGDYATRPRRSPRTSRACRRCRRLAGC